MTLMMALLGVELRAHGMIVTIGGGTEVINR